jgi:hypothetical protein
MNDSRKELKASVGPDTRFEVRPVAVPYRLELESRFEALKGRLLEAKLNELWEAGLNSSLRRAANEAAALAWLTPYPLLVFPLLFEEKAHAALAFADRQDMVRQRTRDLLCV